MVNSFMKNFLILFLIVVTLSQGILFFSDKDNAVSVDSLSQISTNESRTVFSSSTIKLDVLGTYVDVEFVDDLGKDIAGQYSSEDKVISIKCPKDGADISGIYGTIAHESAHYALDVVVAKGIKDQETTAYIVGYVTREAIKNIKCEFNN
jgi:hypothetical protein